MGHVPPLACRGKISVCSVVFGSLSRTVAVLGRQRPSGTRLRGVRSPGGAVSCNS